MLSIDAVKRLRARLLEIESAEGGPWLDVEWLRVRCDDTLGYEGELQAESLMQLRQDALRFVAGFPQLIADALVDEIMRAGERSADLRHVEDALGEILVHADAGLPTEQVDEMLSLVKAGEPGVALENFCTQLDEYDVVMPDGVVTELRMLALLMGMKQARWRVGASSS